MTQDAPRFEGRQDAPRFEGRDSFVPRGDVRFDGSARTHAVTATPRVRPVGSVMTVVPAALLRPVRTRATVVAAGRTANVHPVGRLVRSAVPAKADSQ